MPSGVPAGSDLGPELRAALQHHVGTPLKYQPVIEEGTYDDFKACVFRVCSSRALQVSMEDVKAECQRNQVTCEFYEYLWGYLAPRQLVTSVQVRMVFKEPMPLAVEDFLKQLANSHDFTINKLCQNFTGHRVEGLRYGHGFRAFRDTTLEVEMEITWPYWL